MMNQALVYAQVDKNFADGNGGSGSIIPRPYNLCKIAADGPDATVLGWMGVGVSVKSALEAEIVAMCSALDLLSAQDE